jgi:hypothetical protein
MYMSHRTTLLAALLLSPLPSLRAQTAADPSGHWEGAVNAPFGELGMEVDLAKNSKGDIAGTYTNLQGNLRGFPLSSVVVEGKSVRFVLKAGSGGGTFDGVLSAEATSISGDFLIGGNYVPFNLHRTGDARIEATSKSPAISKEMEGAWNGTLEVSGTKMRLELTMLNEPDGTSTGTVDLDGGLTIPIAAIRQKASDLTFELKSVGASFSGVLNRERTAIAGTYTEGSLTTPLNFQRAATTKDKKK